MQNTYSTLFYPKGSNTDKNGLVPIYARITVNGKRSEFSIKRKVSQSKWNSEAGKLKGTTIEVREFNRFLNNVRTKINKLYDKLVENEETITADKLKLLYQGKSLKPKMLLAIFQEHNDKIENLVGKEYAPGTIERYKTAKKHVEDFIKLEYRASDIPVKDVDHKFITGLEYYLKTERNCAHNTAIKYVTNFKKIIRIAFANDWISKDPFLNWKAKLKIVEREFLTEDEIQRIIEKELHTERLDQVKDIFLFSCFTGLAYADVKKLATNDVVLGIDGGKWIKINRSKTDTRSSIPLLPTALAILEKYQEHPEVSKNGKLLPVLSNQKMNAYIKEIADLCKIHKNLTFHLARHTFATTITLSNGVSIESVSKMLGHKNLRTTQHYAKILDQKVSEDMMTLRNKMQNNPVFN
ncbi:site-specific recombinase XerD [Leeuwenhoekiella aestuarii]|uniref:site-specific integrase n=1 Tax=Leeuwenhoekiella aestuarii TaxID=2249426 RepID=UPI000FFE6D95|nr:site-specific integrase [Leeuwenhoekiella aestuarii]RXG17140.1 site-specific recombinase XerD [Leeuwenhoekiella aestuarii]